MSESTLKYPVENTIADVTYFKVRMQEAIYANLELTGVNDFKYTLPSEIGGINALEALHLAATLGKSALDADMVGRAFPRTWMTVRGIMGENSFPAAMADGNGAVVVSHHHP